MPPCVTKLNRESEIPRQLSKKFAQCRFPIAWHEGRRKLDKDYLKLGFEWFNRAEKIAQLGCTISQPAHMCDVARKLAGEPKRRRSHFHPTTNGIFGRNSMKSGVDLDSRKIVGVEFQPARFRQFRRIENTPPIVEAPCTRADAYLLLIGKIQMKLEMPKFPKCSRRLRVVRTAET